MIVGEMSSFVQFCPVVPNKNQHTPRWHKNHALIADTVVSLTRELMRAPTNEEIADKCGLSTKSIQRHFSEYKFDYTESPYRALTNDVVMFIYNGARKGNPSCMKLWFQIVEGWKDSKEITGKDGGPIELKAQQLDYSKLSDDELETLLRIENKARIGE